MHHRSNHLPPASLTVRRQRPRPRAPRSAIAPDSTSCRTRGTMPLRRRSWGANTQIDPCKPCRHTR